MEEEKAQLQEFNRFEDSSSSSNIVEYLMENSSSSISSGIHGRLEGDLGSINKKYKTAISIAASSSLDKIFLHSSVSTIHHWFYLEIDSSSYVHQHQQFIIDFILK